MDMSGFTLPPEVVSQQATTLWDGNVSWRAQKEAGFITLTQALTRAMPLLLFVEPQEVYLHATPKTLVVQGAEAMAFGRKYLPKEMKLSFALAGDADDPGVPGFHDFWKEAAELALAERAASFQPNTEGAWSRRGPAAMEEAMAVLEPYVTTMELTHTSFPGPVNIRIPGSKSGSRWGYGRGYPYKQALAVGKPYQVKRTYPQVYWASNDGEKKARGQCDAPLYLHQLSWEAGAREGRTPHSIPRGVYLQAYGCRTDDLCTVSSCFPWTQWWAFKTRLEAEGLVAAAAMAKLARLGMTISQFQAANGLKVDRIVGPKTLRALGVDVDRARLLCA